MRRVLGSAGAQKIIQRLGRAIDPFLPGFFEGLGKQGARSASIMDILRIDRISMER